MHSIYLPGPNVRAHLHYICPYDQNHGRVTLWNVGGLGEKGGARVPTVDFTILVVNTRVTCREEARRFVTELCVLRTFGGVYFSLIFICAQSVPEFLWDRLRASIQFPVLPKRAQYARFSALSSKPTVGLPSAAFGLGDRAGFSHFSSCLHTNLHSNRDRKKSPPPGVGVAGWGRGALPCTLLALSGV